ncbi:hypothetical protein BCR15_12905 [Tessaracoccus lapidicaptus]|uniref:DUF2721 domain-containing protein n=1 Tax=Tessaracoccus lapidicaptus TaxID=1427523 RepID=A0A1C0AR84_9ACTN|nr:hypothetical protein [Tessaracoccus lapidicaptus]OCL36836.1 hypothetical protein BCR15_12905 [Tessaracoccus lapidicaptus]
MDLAYAAPLATVLVAVIGAAATYVTRRDERTDALRELEIIERLYSLTGVSEEFVLATEALKRRLERWEARDRDKLFSQASMMLFGGILALGVLQAVAIATFGPSGDWTAGWRTAVNWATLFAFGIAALGALSLVLQVAATVVGFARGWLSWRRSRRYSKSKSQGGR